MKHDIDIFANHGGASLDHRWDHDRNAGLLNIVFYGGTFGTFLKFFLDKFSDHSPEIEGDPFTDIGSSHAMANRKFSGLFQRYHSSFINDNEGQTDLPICIITPSTKKHFLFLKKAQWFKPPSFDNNIAQRISPDDLFKKAFGEMPDFLQASAKEIKDLYAIKETAHFTWIPKFIVRDWYKLEFLQDIKETFQHKWFEQFKDHEFFSRQNVFDLDLESFFNWDDFLKNIKTLDEVFGLSLDFDRQDEMKTMFDKGYELDHIRKECDLVERVLEIGTDDPLTDLDVSSEAFIYAHFEKQYPDIQLPLTNRFFRDHTEIIQYLEYFPNWYRRKNPNLG